MATPDIGKSISEGYGRGLDRVGTWLPTLAVFAVLSAIVAGGSAQIQSALVPDADDVLGAIFSGSFDGLSESDLRMITLVGGISGAINYLIGFGIYVVLGGALHRERHGSDGAIPGPGGAIPALLEGVGALMPKVAILIALFLGTQLASLLGGVGILAGLVAWVFFIMLSIRWIYAPIVAGGGEGSGDAAYARSEEAVSGSWWGTFGCFIVIGLATVVPFAVGGAILGAIVPGTLLSAAVSAFVISLVGLPVFASALESAWSQVEGGTDGGDAEFPPAAPPTTEQPPANEPPSGPFV